MTGLLVDDDDGARRRARPRAARRRVPRAARQERARARVAVHVGGDGARHARGPRGRGAAPHVRRERICSVDAPAAVGARLLAARAARVRPAAAHRAGQGRAPTPSSTSISIRAGCCRARSRCGIRTSAWARSRTRRSVTRSRWARTTGSSTSSARPAGSRNGSGSARCCFAAALGVLYLLRTFGLRGPGVVVAALAYMCTPYVLDYAARISVLLMPWAALPWMIAVIRKALRREGLALSRDLRA